MGNSIYWLDAKVDYGAVGDNTADDTTALQNAITGAGSAGKPLVIPNGTYKITSPLTLPAGGLYVCGVDSAGNFTSVIRPNNCSAFTISSVHHVIIEKLTIWPQGASPPANYIYLTNCYSIVLRDIRLHLATGQSVCSGAAILQDAVGGGCNDILFDHFIVRSDGSSYPIGWQFNSGCGSARISNCDLETCNVGIQWNGGQITVDGLYSERFGQQAIYCLPSTDANASMTVLGGILRSSASGYPIAIDQGTKNLSVNGTYMDSSGHGYQFYVVTLTGLSDIYLNFANPDSTQWAGTPSLTNTSALIVTPPNPTRITPAYSASITPTIVNNSRIITASITATNNTAFTVNAPTGFVQDGARLTIVIRNTSGGALGAATFAAAYKKGAAWTQPANGFSRSIDFVYDGTNWIEYGRTAADVSN
jgi:hypothetical protein